MTSAQHEVPVEAADAEAERLIIQLRKVASPESGMNTAEQEVAEELRKVGPKAIPLLLPLLKDANEAVRQLASYTLRDIDGITEKHLEALIESRRRGDGWIPPAIAQIGTPKAIDFLIQELVRERQSHTQLTWALAKAGEKAAPKIAALFRQTDIEWDTALESAIHNVLEEGGDKSSGAVAPLLESAADDGASEAARIRALGAIGSIGRSAEWAVPRMLEMRRGQSDSIREAAERAIINTGSKRAVPILAERLEGATSPRGVVDQLQAISELRERGKDAGPFVEKYLANEDWEVRLAAVKTVGYIGHREVAVKLMPFLERADDWRLVYGAAESLGWMQFEGAVSALESVAAKHWFPAVRYTAEQSIQAIKDRAPFKPETHDPFYLEFNSHESVGDRANWITREDATAMRFPANVVAEELVPVPGKFHSNRTENDVSRLGLKVEHGYLVAVDEGEWGGSLDFVALSGATTTIYGGNTSAIHRAPQGIYAVCGIAHMIDNYGIILKVSVDAQGKWTFQPWRTLPGAPIFSRLLKDGSLFVSCYTGTVVISPSGDMQWFTRKDAGLPPRAED